MINLVLDFERSSFKKKSFKILTLYKAGNPNGAPKQFFFDWYDIRDPKATCWPNLKVLGTIIKKLINLTILGPPGNFLGALNQNSVPKEFSAMVRTTHSENLKALAKKLKEEIDFNRKPCFWPRDLWPFDLWPQKKDGHNPWGTIYLPCKFGKDPPTGSGLNRSGPTNHPTTHPNKLAILQIAWGTASPRRGRE